MRVSYSHDDDGWDISAHVQKAEQEDAPEEIADRLPQDIFLTEIILEGGASDYAIALADETARHIARASRGIFINLQTGAYEDHEGHTLDVPPPRHQTCDILAFSWWFNDSPLGTKEGLSQFLQALQRTLPEALPRRYGSYPPKFHFTASQPDHFVDYALNEISEYAGFVSWLTTHPVMNAILSIDSRHSGAQKLGFKANTLHINVDIVALENIGQPRLEIFWREISAIVRPFYGDIRTLKNHLRGRTEIWIGPDTQEHPVNTCWWKGLPNSLGHAVVLGEPYLSLWPKFTRAAAQSAGQAFLSTTDWKSSQDLSKRTGGAPITLRQGLSLNGYSLHWPFDGPYSAKAKQ